MRKINAAVRDKLTGPKGFAKAESRRLSKAQSADEREAIARDFATKRATLLAERPDGYDLTLPSASHCAAWWAKQEVKQEVKQEAAPAPAPAPAPTLLPQTESDQMRQQLQQAKADTHAAWQANVDEAERRREEVLRFKQQLDRRGPPKSPPRQRPPKADVGADAYVAFEAYVAFVEARAAARAAHEAAHAHYLEQRRQLERMLEQLLALYGQEDTLRAAADAAEDAYHVLF